MSDLGVAHPSWATASDSAPFSLGTKKAFSSSKIPPPPCLPPWASPPSSELAQHSVFPSLPATLGLLSLEVEKERSEFGGTAESREYNGS